MKILLFDFGTIISGDRDEITKFNNYRNRTDDKVFLVAGDVIVKDYRSAPRREYKNITPEYTTGDTEKRMWTREQTLAAINDEVSE